MKENFYIIRERKKLRKTRKMKQYNIAQIGAFDYENLGDILFTDVLHRQLEKRIPIGKHMLFALNEVKKPLSESDSTVYGIDRLEEMHLAVHFDAVIIGGGDLIGIAKGHGIYAHGLYRRRRGFRVL